MVVLSEVLVWCWSLVGGLGDWKMERGKGLRRGGLVWCIDGRGLLCLAMFSIPISYEWFRMEHKFLRAFTNVFVF